MLITESLVAPFQYFFVTAYGASILFLLSGVPRTKRNILSMSGLAILCYLLALVAISIFGLGSSGLVYALCVHIPFALFVTLRFKRPFSMVLVAHFMTFFSLAPGLVVANLSAIVTERLALPIEEMAAMRIGGIVSYPLLFWSVRKWLVPPIRELLEQSRQARQLLLIVVGSAYVLTQAVYFDLQAHQNAQSYFFSVLFSLAMAAFIVSLVFYSRKLRENEEIKTNLVAYSVQAEGLALYINSLTASFEETARLRHDQRHFLSLLDLHATRGDLTGIRDLVGENRAVLESMPLRVTGNGAVDAILALFRKRAGAQGVSLEIRGCDLTEIPIPANDLCLLLSNCLENAIDAAKLAAAGARVVGLDVSRNFENGNLTLMSRNPVTDPVTFDPEGMPQTAKGPGHGYGTRSMRTVVRKHGGVCGFSVEGGEFVFRVVFFSSCAAGDASGRSDG